jgi:hypothetical protein
MRSAPPALCVTGFASEARCSVRMGGLSKQIEQRANIARDNAFLLAS